MKQSTLHVAVIMDGNGRWATRQNLPRFAGHQAGAESLRGIVEAAPAAGIATLTAYAFSADNWKRESDEVAALMALLASYLEHETPRLFASNVRLSVIGRRDRLPDALLAAIADAEQTTGRCTGLHLRLAIDYSSREAILRSALTEPVDLLIRTGGEQRLSDFLLWECAYAELHFTRRMWPEFSPRDLSAAVTDFHRRQRRFGGTPAIPPPVSAGQERWLR
jgi:undecaprenyl diphosphate synthase